MRLNGLIKQVINSYFFNQLSSLKQSRSKNQIVSLLNLLINSKLTISQLITFILKGFGLNTIIVHVNFAITAKAM